MPRLILPFLAAAALVLAPVAEAAEVPAKTVPETVGPTGTAPTSPGAALVEPDQRTNANSAVGGTGELPNSGALSGGVDPAGSPTNCMVGDSRPHCAKKLNP